MLNRLLALVTVTVAACSGSPGGEQSVADAGPGSTPDAGPPGTPDAGQHPAPDAAPPGSPDAGSTSTVPVTTLASVDDGLAYAATLTIGGQIFALDVDTGSTTTAVAGVSCTSCSGLTPRYMPGTTASDERRATSSEFGDGSSWRGEIYEDTASILASLPTVQLKFVDITSQSNFFEGNDYQGILGLGPSILLEPGTTALEAQLVAAGMPNAFALELCNDNGRLWLGGFDSTFTAAAPEYSPILATNDNDPFYSVKLNDVAIAGTTIGVSDYGPAVTDSGTSLLLVPTDAYNALLSQIGGSSGFMAAFPGVTLDDVNCNTTSMTAAELDAALPQMTMTFAGTGQPFTVSLKPTQSYLFQQSDSTWCFGVDDSQGNGTILGDMFLRSFVTVFDLANSRIGFAPEAGCTSTARAEAPPQAGPSQSRPRPPGIRWPQIHPSLRQR